MFSTLRKENMVTTAASKTGLAKPDWQKHDSHLTQLNGVRVVARADSTYRS